MPAADDGTREFEAVIALRDAMATRAHAEMLFAQVADLFGDAGWVDVAVGGASRWLFRREEPGSPWVIPWPVLSLARGGRAGPSPIRTAIPGVYEEPRVRPGPAPKIRGLGPGSLTIHDGPECVTIAYGADGRWFETVVTHPRRTLAGAVRAFAARSASPVELAAAFVAGIDPARHGPGRVRLPVAVPQGVKAVWNGGLFAIRQALFEEQVPAEGRWVAADGWTGRAIAFGPTRDAALAAWREEVARVRPYPGPAPKTEIPEMPEGPSEAYVDIDLERPESGFSGVLFARALEVEAPEAEPSPENAPAAVFPVPELPGSPPPFGGWVRTVGERGAVRFAALLREAGGRALVGDLVLEQGIADVADLDARLAPADRAWDEWRAAHPTPPFELPPGFPPPAPTDTSAHRYEFIDRQTGLPVAARRTSAGRSQGFDARGLDADSVRGEVVRMRRDRR
jgi:hypothetical protein